MERFFEILNNEQLHFETDKGIELFDTSMDFDGQKFDNSNDILQWLTKRYQ